MTDSVSGNFVEVHNPMLDIFNPTPRDNSIIEYQYTEYINKDGSDLASRDSLPQYEIYNNDRDTYTNLYDSYLECRFKIRPAARPEGFFNQGNIAFVNSALHLFKRAEYYIDNKLIESVEQPGIIENIKGLAQYSLDSEQQLSAELWAPDRGDGGIYQSNYKEFQLISAIVAANQTISINANSELEVSGADADGAVVKLILGDNNDTLIYIDGLRATRAITKNGGGGAQPIRYAGIAAGQLIKLRTSSSIDTELRLFLLTSVNNSTYREVELVATAVPNIGIRYKDTGALVGAAFAAGSLFARYKYNVYSNNEDNNTGFYKRLSKSFNPTNGLYDQMIVCKIPLKKLFNFFDYNRILLKGVVHRILLYRNDQARMLYRDANTAHRGALNAAPAQSAADQDGRVIMHYLSWWVPRCLPNRQWEALLNEKIGENTTTSLGFHSYEYFTYGTLLSANENVTVNWNITTATKKPVRVYIFFQKQNAITSQLINTCIYQTLPVSTIYIRMNGLRYPLEDYKLSFEDLRLSENNPQWLRIYNEFLKAGNTEHITTTGPSITYDEFKKLYQIFTFDLSHQDDDRIWQSQTTAIMEVIITFSERLPGAADDRYVITAIIETEHYGSLSGVGNTLQLLIN